MTREEAISVLYMVEAHGLADEAKRMAIKALQAEIDGDIISRADAIEAVENLQTEQWIDSDIDYNNGLQSAIAEIRALPSADRPQGEWKHTITMQPYCSNCEYVFGEDEEFSPFWNYCPMCGARIKGGDTK